jgi:hypothetical protein
VVYVVRTWKSRQTAAAISASAPEEMDTMRRRAREETDF